MYKGKIMWISQRDGNGVLLADVDGYTLEFYFDSSVFKDFKGSKRGDKVSFTPKVLDRINCARDLELTGEVVNA